MTFRPVSRGAFLARLLRTVDGPRGDMIRDALAPREVWCEHFPIRGRYCLDDDGAGFAVVEGALRGAFAEQPGRGDDIVTAAVDAGATHLDHFDVGRLSALYERHGFVEVRREPNWTPGGPDVVYRARRAPQKGDARWRALVDYLDAAAGDTLPT